jgi:hypothetical protein
VVSKKIYDRNVTMFFKMGSGSVLGSAAVIVELWSSEDTASLVRVRISVQEDLTILYYQHRAIQHSPEIRPRNGQASE